MSKEIKRVPKDFKWPRGKPWHGYLIDFCVEPCSSCIRFAKEKGMPMTRYNCPDFEEYMGPPKGDAYQIWDMVKGGYPVSPVFETVEDMAEWLSSKGRRVFPAHIHTKEEWITLLNGSGMGQITK